MGMIIKLNRSGTLGVSLSKEMKEAGYTQGLSIVWVKQADGFLLKLEHVKMNAAPVLPPVEAKPPPTEQSA